MDRAGNAGGRRVLVVDDDEAIGESIAEVLGDEGYEVAVARNGERALAWLREHEAPGLILLDLMMPVMDGYTFRRHQLADPALAAIPTLAVTAGAVDDRILDMKLPGWLRKPSTLEALLAAVERWCRPPAAGSCHARDGVAPGHTVHYYRSPEGLASSVVPFITEGLDAGEAVMVIVTHINRVHLERALVARGVDVAGLQRVGRLAIMEPAALLDRVQVDGVLSQARLEALARESLDALRAAAPSGRFRVFGETVNVLWQSGDLAAAVRLEALWNEICARDPFPLHCAYLIDVAQAAEDAQVREAVTAIDREHDQRRIA